MVICHLRFRVCHTGMSGMSGMSCKYVMGICHEHMSCMYQRCHVSTRYVIKVCHACVSCRCVMVIYHWDSAYVMQVCHEDMS